MDFATVLATFSPELREEVLLTSEEDLINSLPPALLAEAQALRQRVMQAYRSASQLLFLENRHGLSLSRDNGCELFCCSRCKFPAMLLHVTMRLHVVMGMSVIGVSATSL